MRSPRRVGSAFLVTCLYLTSACDAGERRPRVERTDSAGVEIVTAPAADHALDWGYQAVFTVGGEEEGPEAFYAVDAGLVGSDSLGNVYVLDHAAARVVVFDTSGNVVRTMGRRGGGPGELRDANSLAVAADGSTAVFDFSKQGLVRFGPRGEVLTEVLFPFFPMPNRQRHIGQLRDRMLVSTRVAAAEAGQGLNGLRSIGPADTALLAAIPLPPPRMVRYPTCGGGLNLPPVFSPELVWDVAADRVAVNAVPAYRIDIYENGRLARSVRRKFDPAPATRELAEQELGDGFKINFGRGVCTIAPAEMVDGRGFAGTVPAISGVRIAPDGALWVQRYVIGEKSGGAIDIFDATGAYTGTLPSATPLPLLLLRGGRAAIAVKDEQTDVERLAVVEVRDARGRAPARPRN